MKIALIGCGAILGFFLLAGCAPEERNDDTTKLIIEGWKFFKWTDFNKSEEVFNDALENSNVNSGEYLQALYGLATVWNLRRPDNNPELAAEYYRKIIASVPESDLAAWSQLALVRMEHLVAVGHKVDRDKVIAAYEKVIKEFPGTSVAIEALIYQQLLELQRFDEKTTKAVVKKLKFFANAHPDSNYTYMAWWLVASGYEQLNDYKEMVTALEKELETIQCGPKQKLSWTYWKIATISKFELGDFKKSKIYYQKILKEYPKDMTVYGVKAALKDMDELENKLRAELREDAFFGGEK
jgi:tetratricopeptide (TPR) repeat protein